MSVPSCDRQRAAPGKCEPKYSASRVVIAALGQCEVKRLGALKHSHDNMAVSSSGISASNCAGSASYGPLVGLPVNHAASNCADAARSLSREDSLRPGHHSQAARRKTSLNLLAFVAA